MRSQEEPGAAGKSQEEPGGARRSQEEPGGAKMSKKEQGASYTLARSHFRPCSSKFPAFILFKSIGTGKNTL